MNGMVCTAIGHVVLVCWTKSYTANISLGRHGEDAMWTTGTPQLHCAIIRARGKEVGLTEVVNNRPNPFAVLLVCHQLLPSSGVPHAHTAIIVAGGQFGFVVGVVAYRA